MTTALLELQAVTKRFDGLVALSEVDLTVMAGEFVSVIGPNGAGKSTLFNVITGVLAPSAGTVTIKGERIRRFRQDLLHARGLGRTFQVARSVGTLSVRENIVLGAGGARLRGVISALRSRSGDRALQRRVDELIEFTGLAEVAEQDVGEVSPGHLRRMEIARALADEPDLILLDEPAAGIGADGLQPLKALLKAIHQRGIAVLLVEHYVGLALSLCDRAVALEAGAVLAQGPPDRIRADQRVIDAYLGTRHAGSAPGEAAGGRTACAGDVALDVQAVTAGYRRTEVLHEVSLQVRQGEFVTVLGSNGAGKSTLIKALMGLIPARGAVALHGRDILALQPYERVAAGIAYVPEGRRVFPALTVVENLRVANRTLRAGALDEIYSIFPRLAERHNQLAGTLSGGEQQMLALGRTLISQPVLLLADEISLGLAPLVVESLFGVLKRLNRDGMAILLAEQNASEALRYADTTYVMETGRITLHGPAAELATDRRIVEAYLQVA